MSELSPGTRALLRAARAAREVPDGAADRVRDAVEQSAALIASGAHPVPPGPPSPAWAFLAPPKLAGLAAVALALGAAALRTAPAVPPPPPAVAPTVRPVAAPALPASPFETPPSPFAPVAPPRALRSAPPSPRLARTLAAPAEALAPPIAAPAPVASVVPAAPAPVEPAAPAAPPTVDAPTLADEVRALGAARASLRAGAPAGALDTLDAYARRHPGGSLRDEADALRVRALCDAGRRDDARAVATSLLTRAPHSPLAPTVRRSCVFDVP